MKDKPVIIDLVNGDKDEDVDMQDVHREDSRTLSPEPAQLSRSRQSRSMAPPPPAPRQSWSQNQNNVVQEQDLQDAHHIKTAHRVHDSFNRTYSPTKSWIPTGIRPRVGSRYKVTIELLSDNEDEGEASYTPIPLPVGGKASMNQEEIINLIEEEVEAAAEAADALYVATGRSNNNRFALRNPPIAYPLVIVESRMLHQRVAGLPCWTELKPGMTVELNDGSFLFLLTIIKNTVSGEVKLKGRKALRIGTELLNGKMERKPNELCFVEDVDLDDPRPGDEQSVCEALVQDVKKIRTLYRTNKPIIKGDPLRYQELRKTSRDFRSREDQKRWVSENDVLVVRWIFIRQYDNAALRHRDNSGKPTYRTCSGYTLRRLSEEECCPGLFETAEVLRANFRGTTNLGGSAKQDIPDLQEIDHVQFRKGFNSVMEAKSMYTFADTYCGAGGASGGAVMAGLKVVLATDIWAVAEEVYRANFPDAKFFLLPVHKFCNPRDPGNQYEADILHLSCPCQTWSPAKHGAVCAEDDDRADTIFSVDPLLKLIKPRFVTSEQTFGFLFKRYTQPFNAFIRQFTDNGYSVSWRAVELQNYGLPAKRTRLLKIAAAPGEKLFPFPKPTHSNNPRGGLKELATVNSVLRSIPRNAPDHDLNWASDGSKLPAYNGNDIFRATICSAGATRTLNGSRNARVGIPNGERRLTIRELATIQGFGPNHTFLDPTRRISQLNLLIGNAYPSVVGKVIFDGIRKHLEMTDRAELRLSRGG